jgi:cytochrome c553
MMEFPRMTAVLVAMLALLFMPQSTHAAETVPTDVQMPGTQPEDGINMESVSKCDNCHGNFANPSDPREEPWFNWAGGMMAHAARDPLFWATVAIGEQDFDGSGDLCIRCHVAEGWLDGRSTPTDGSGLADGDADGVQCDLCHKLTNPDDSEHLGEQNVPFIANDGATPATAFYGNGMYVVSGGNAKLGPYDDAEASHQFLASQFHRSVDYCGTCHDVSNPVVGDLAHNNGAQPTADPVVSSGVPGSAVTGKAAFNNFPYQYGVVERTFSEYKSGALVATRVADYMTLPTELRAGSIERARDAALLAGANGDYADGAPRYFSCQTCHMRPTMGQGCNKNPPIRNDLPEHDQTGGNYWMPDVIQYLDARDELVLGGGLSSTQNDALDAGKLRARQNLEDAASLSVDELTRELRVVNLTGHKLITGYPEGRRMWLNIRWYDDQDALIREDGAYGPLVDSQGNPVEAIDPSSGQPVQVESLLEPDDPDTRVYEAHYGMTQEWAGQLLSLGKPPNLPLTFDRKTGAVTLTLGELGAQAPGTSRETFHFVLNNTIMRDNRIPTWQMSYDEARIRNALPVPADQYGNPGPGGVYDHFDVVPLDPPATAIRGEIDLLYQPTSWEYIQFLQLANEGTNAFLGEEGDKMLKAWLNTGMAAPHTMASTTITVPEPGSMWSIAAGIAFLATIGRRRASC